MLKECILHEAAILFCLIAVCSSERTSRTHREWQQHCWGLISQAGPRRSRDNCVADNPDTPREHLRFSKTLAFPSHVTRIPLVTSVCLISPLSFLSFFLFFLSYFHRACSPATSVRKFPSQDLSPAKTSPLLFLSRSLEGCDASSFFFFLFFFFFFSRNTVDQALSVHGRTVNDRASKLLAFLNI